jgi:hypothetical protein
MIDLTGIALCQISCRPRTHFETAPAGSVGTKTQNCAASLLYDNADTTRHSKYFAQYKFPSRENIKSSHCFTADLFSTFIAGQCERQKIS